MIKTLLTTLAIVVATDCSAAPVAPPTFPVSADVKYTAPPTSTLLKGFFLAKSEHNVDKTMSYVSPGLLTYTDSTVGWPLDGFAALKGVFGKYMPNWPATGLSYPVRILGGPNSALVEFIDTKELFGSELRVFGVVDFKDGKIIRWVDYWDGNSVDPKLYGQLRTPEANFPKDYKDAAVAAGASARMTSVATQLQTALAAGDAEAAAALFNDAAVLDDRTLRTEIAGRAAIGRYWGRALKDLPYGAGSKTRHVVGGDHGGGFEWFAGPAYPIGHGVTALELGADGKIIRASIVYDGRKIPAQSLTSLSALALEP